MKLYKFTFEVHDKDLVVLAIARNKYDAEAKAREYCTKSGYDIAHSKMIWVRVLSNTNNEWAGVIS